MNTNTFIGFGIGVAVGVGGTLLVDYLMNKRERGEEDLEGEDVYVLGADTDSGINPDNVVRSGPLEEKPDLEEVVSYTEYAKTYNPNAETDAETILDRAERSKREDEIEKEETHQRIFDREDAKIPEDEPKPTKQDAIPPSQRNKKIPKPHDIEEISHDQYYHGAPDYEKKSCTYFIHEDKLVSDDDELMVIDETVGRKILELVERDGDTYYVTNISTEIDYEIVGDERSYPMVAKKLKYSHGSEDVVEEDSGDASCQDNPS